MSSFRDQLLKKTVFWNFFDTLSAIVMALILQPPRIKFVLLPSFIQKIPSIIDLEVKPAINVHRLPSRQRCLPLHAVICGHGAASLPSPPPPLPLHPITIHHCTSITISPAINESWWNLQSGLALCTPKAEYQQSRCFTNCSWPAWPIPLRGYVRILVGYVDAAAKRELVNRLWASSGCCHRQWPSSRVGTRELWVGMLTSQQAMNFWRHLSSSLANSPEWVCCWIRML